MFASAFGTVILPASYWPTNPHVFVLFGACDEPISLGECAPESTVAVRVICETAAEFLYSSDLPYGGVHIRQIQRISRVSRCGHGFKGHLAYWQN